MALSYTNRRRTETPTSIKSWPLKQHQQQQHQQTIANGSAQIGVRKQYSFIETTSAGRRSNNINSSGQNNVNSNSNNNNNNNKYTAQQRGYLSRGLSVGRSIESIRQKLYADPQKLNRQNSIDTTSSVKLTQLQTGTKNVTKQPPSGILDAKLRGRRSLVAWSSTTSLQKSLDHENVGGVNGGSILAQKGSSDAVNQSIRDSTDSNKTDNNRINLNIVLSQTIRATTEQEPNGHSDIESSIDCTDILPNSSETNAAQRRAQFQQSRSIVASEAANNEPTPLLQNAACINIAGCTQLSVSPPALTVQRRPPLVRAMSAPVRSLDEHAKHALSIANKRQPKTFRRRKILTRNISCDKSSAAASNILNGSESDVNAGVSEGTGTGAGNKKVLARSRTVASTDVITLVSLLSSEGSDSEKEDTTAAGNTNKSENSHSPNRRAPLLRKTGKSVSFQDSYPPTFQLASKEYSHMIRRGSIAPLAARIRSNRPPTAPPVSIFLNADKMNDGTMSAGSGTASDVTVNAAKAKSIQIMSNADNKTVNEKENNASNCNQQQQQQTEPEYNYPDYVRSIKERECWKLYQKMSAKGVTVTYDTILRGMLTPTEFRQFQKQRDLEEAKAKEAAEAAGIDCATDKPKMPATAIERLSESLLNLKK